MHALFPVVIRRIPAIFAIVVLGVLRPGEPELGTPCIDDGPVIGGLADGQGGHCLPSIGELELPILQEPGVALGA